jgi:hypothetical protein
MLLEFKVWGSREWYEQAVPMLEEAGLKDRPDLAWADPDTDGEKMGCYYDYADEKEGLDPGHLADVLTRVRKVVLNGEAPDIEISFVPSR